jgi:protein involved in polysaccharide export with SLBB domain
MDDAALTKCYIQRGNEKVPVNLFETVGKGRLDPAIQAMVLRAGDILVVPAIDNRFQVMGQVSKPGEFPIPETKDIRVLDALGLAGGPTQVADLKKAGVFRVADGKPTIIKVDFVKMQRSGDMTKNFVLQKDDMLFLPMRGPAGFRIESLMSPLSMFYYLGRL